MPLDRKAIQKTRLLASCLVVVLIPTLLAAPSPLADERTVAVADCTAAPGTPADWAYGIADLMALELQSHGVVLLERRDVRWILAERERQFMDRPDAGAVPFADVPQLDALVSGTIRRTAADRFHLEIGLTDLRAGTEMASADATGQWAVDLPAAVAAIANRLTRHLQDSTPDEAVPRLSGFSRSPEISWLFYRGIAHCLIDEPEWGRTFSNFSVSTSIYRRIRTRPGTCWNVEHLQGKMQFRKESGGASSGDSEGLARLRFDPPWKECAG